MKKLFTAIISLAICAGAAFAAVPREVKAAAPRITNTATYIGNLNVAPSLISELKNAEQLTSYDGYAKNLRPSNVIITVDETLAVKGENGETIGTLTEVHAALKKNTILSVVRLGTTAAADAFAAWTTENEVFDISVLSGDMEVLRYARTLKTNIRGIADFSEAKPENLYEIVKSANEAFAHVVIFSKAQADAETVYYLQARFKAVWIIAESSGEFDIYSLVSRGAYGIITDGDTREIYKYYDSYSRDSIARPFYNIGHRGVGFDYAENSLEALIAAYEGGATAVEIDMKVSSDGQVFVMHDSTLATTTNGTGNPESMTMAKLKEFNIVKDSNGASVAPCKIPTLDEIFTYFKDKEDIVIICEIKTTNSKIIELFGKKVQEYGVADKVVSIAFATGMLEGMKNNPLTAGIPTAYLNGLYQASAVEDLQSLCRNNAVIDAKTDHEYFEERNLKNRGYMSYSWTYIAKSDVNIALKLGTVGITTNSAHLMGAYQKRILPKDGYTVKSESELDGATFKADILLYDRTTAERDVSVFKYEVCDGYVNAIFKYTDNGYTIYSTPAKITIKPDGGQKPDDKPPAGEEENKDGGGKGCKGSAVGGSVLVTALAAAALGLIKKSKTN